MKTLNQISVKLNELKSLIKEANISFESLRKEMVSMSKFNIGEKVKVKDGDIAFIGRVLVNQDMFSKDDTFYIYYELRKMKKDGTISAQSYSYKAYKECDLSTY